MEHRTLVVDKLHREHGGVKSPGVRMWTGRDSLPIWRKCGGKGARDEARET